MTKYGYACINMSLHKVGIQTGRTMNEKTFIQKGLNYVSELAIKNVTDLKKIIEWNIINDIKVYRVSSNIFPWWSKYDIYSLPEFNAISKILKDIGEICIKNEVRLSFHPDHFVKLASDNGKIVEESIREIDRHSLFFDIMGFEANHYNKINIHIGGSYNDKLGTLSKFCNNFYKLNNNAQKRLTVENDDKQALYTVEDLYSYMNQMIGVPIVFDFHHHNIHNNGMSEQEAFEIAYKTWDKIPIFHYSESSDTNLRGHSEYVKNIPNTYNKEVNIMIEAKGKDLAIIELRNSRKI